MSDIHALSGAYATDALDAAEAAAFEEHLAGCADCRTEVAELRETLTHLAAAAETAPPAGLRERLLADIGTVRPLPPLVEPSPVEAPRAQPSADLPVEPAPELAEANTAGPVPLHRTPAARRRAGRSRWAPALASAAAAVALVGAGLAIAQPWQDEPRQSQQLTAADRVMADPQAQTMVKDFDGGARATLVRSPAERRAVITTEAMPAAPDGMAYQLWLQVDGEMVPAGVMPPRADQTVLLDGDAMRATAVGITVEPDGGSPAPTSEPIAVFAFQGT